MHMYVHIKILTCKSDAISLKIGAISRTAHTHASLV
jgi:hypothetical protein